MAASDHSPPSVSVERTASGRPARRATLASRHRGEAPARGDRALVPRELADVDRAVGDGEMRCAEVRLAWASDSVVGDASRSAHGPRPAANRSCRSTRAPSAHRSPASPCRPPCAVASRPMSPPSSAIVTVCAASVPAIGRVRARRRRPRACSTSVGVDVERERARREIGACRGAPTARRRMRVERRRSPASRPSLSPRAVRGHIEAGRRRRAGRLAPSRAARRRACAGSRTAAAARARRAAARRASQLIRSPAAPTAVRWP